MKILLFVSALAIGNAAFAQQPPAPVAPATAAVEAAVAPATEAMVPAPVQNAAVPTATSAATAMGNAVPACSKSITDECANPTRSGKHVGYHGSAHRSHARHQASAEVRKIAKHG